MALETHVTIVECAEHRLIGFETFNRYLNYSNDQRSV